MSMDDGAAAGTAPPREQGVALMKMGRMAEAAQALQRAVTDDAGDEQSWRMLGGALSARGDQAGALRAFEQAVRLAPASPKNHYNLAVALQATGQLYDAKTHLDQALALNPNYDQARALLDELARQADTRGSGMAQPTGGGDAAPAPSPRPPVSAPTPPATSGGDDLAPVGGPAAFGSGPGVMGEGTSVGGRSAGGDDLASVGGSAGYAGAVPPPGGVQTGVPNQGASPYGPAAPPPYGGPPAQGGGYAPPPVLSGPNTYGGLGAQAPPVKGGQILALAIVSFFICGPILGTMALIQANNALRILDMGGDQAERGKVKAARICAIIALCLSAVFFVVRIATLGSVISGAGNGRP